MIQIIVYSILGIAGLMVLYFILKALMVGFVLAMMIKKNEIERLAKEQSKNEV